MRRGLPRASESGRKWTTRLRLPLAPSSSAFKTFQLAACCLRSGFSLFSSASLSLPMTASKSAVLSGLTKFSTRPTSDAKTLTVGACSSCPACCWDADCDV
jgi:hypothetical protein